MPSQAFADEVRAAIAEILAATPVDSERSMVEDTEYVVADEPTAEELALAEVPQGSILLGLYTSPPSRVTLFAGPIAVSGQRPRDILRHEVGHRLGFDHTLDHVAMGTVATGAGAARATARAAASYDIAGTESLRADWNDACPICKLYAKTAHAASLMADLNFAAQLEHMIPAGLGGTIPLARRDVDEARGFLLLVTPMVPDQADEIAALSTCLTRAQAALSGWLDVADVAAAAERTHVCRLQAYLIARRFYGQAALRRLTA